MNVSTINPTCYSYSQKQIPGYEIPNPLEPSRDPGGIRGGLLRIHDVSQLLQPHGFMEIPSILKCIERGCVGAYSCVYSCVCVYIYIYLCVCVYLYIITRTQKFASCIYSSRICVYIYIIYICLYTYKYIWYLSISRCDFVLCQTSNL